MKYLEVSVVAQKLNVSTETIYRLIRSKKLDAINVSAGTQKRYRVTGESLTRFEAMRG